MISVDEELIDSISAVFYHLHAGKVPAPISIPAELPDNEIRQLLTFVNRFLNEFAPLAEAMKQIAQGDLETRPVFGRMVIVNAFKTLRANLRHLTWKTQQIAGGDLTQRLDFMGDFSAAFNSMTRQLKDSYETLVTLNKELDRRNQFIRKTFGRYTSSEIVDAILDAPNGLELGGEKREVTLLMSDIRGFTVLAEQLEPTEVVSILNHYLSVMVELIQRSGGNIDEIIGDAILVIFGAPLAMDDAAKRAVFCALEMQSAMRGVNAYNHQRGWPEIEIGIALHTGDVVVGNIGSTKRSKYAVVGQTVNVTARMESFTIGGQVLVSPALILAANPGLILGDTVEVLAKGMQETLECRELLGHDDHPELALDQAETSCVVLEESQPLFYVRLTGKHLDEQMQPATLIGLSHQRGVLESSEPLPPYADILLRLSPAKDDDKVLEVYAKVIRTINAAENHYLVHFTSIPPDAQDWLRRRSNRSFTPGA
jgi:adenylate cyclase